MDFSSHRSTSVCSKRTPLGGSSSSKTDPDNVLGTVNKAATAVLSLKDEMLYKEDNLHDDVESNVIFTSSSTAPTHSANMDCSTIPAVSDQPHSVKVTKSEQQIYKRILEKLYTAYENLCPVIDEIISSATECTAPETQTVDCSDCAMCSVTQEQYIGAIKASRLIQEIHNDVVQSDTFNMELIKGDIINFPAADFIVNSMQQSIYTKPENTFSGTSVPRIYIEKNVVNQLVELYNLLHGALEQLSPLAGNKQIPVNQTNKVFSKNCSSVFKLLQTSKTQFKPTSPSSTDNPENSKLLTKLQEEYQGLSDTVDMLKSIIKETSGSIGDIKKLGKNLQEARHTRSDNSVAEIEKSNKITDVSGARRCILECLVELTEVRKYLKNLGNTKEPNVVSEICLTADIKKECCTKQNVPHLHAKLNGIPIVVKLNQETVDTILASVGCYPPCNVNEDRQTGVVGSYQKYKCKASKSSPTIQSSTKLISSDEKEFSSKSRQEYGCKEKCTAKTEPELSLKEVKRQKENKKQKNSIKPKIQMKNSQSFTQINEKSSQIPNQSCKSLDSLLKRHQSIIKRSRSNSSNQMVANKRQLLKQSVNQGDFLAVQLNRQISIGNQKQLEEKSKSISGNTFKKLKTAAATTIPEASKKKSKQLARTSKSKSNDGLLKCSNSGKLLKVGCYTKRKFYKYYTENNPEIALHQIRSINNVNEENDISTIIKKRMNKLYGTCSTENMNAVRYKSDYNLFLNNNEQRTAAIGSFNIIENNRIEQNENFDKLFKVTSEQRTKLCSQKTIDNITKENHTGCKEFPFDIKQEIKKFSGQTVDNETKENYNLMFPDIEKQESNVLSSSFCTNNQYIICEENDTKPMLFTTANKQQEDIKLPDSFLEDHTNNAHKGNELFYNFATKSANNENCNLNNSFIDKFKQKIFKLTDIISPKITDSSVAEEINIANSLIIDEIKQQDIFKFFNTSLVKNSSKLHKESDNSTEITNPLISKEREINKLECGFSNDIITSSERNDKLKKSFASKSKQRIDNILSGNLNRVPEERNIVNKSEIKQKEIIKFYGDFLVENLGAHRESNNLNKPLTFTNNRQKTFKVSNSADMHNLSNTSVSVQANISVKKNMCNNQNSLPLKKGLQYKTLSSIKSRNVSHVNRLIINVNGQSKPISKLPSISELTIQKDAQCCFESKAISKLVLNEKVDNEPVTLKSEGIPYVVSVQSIPKIKMEKVRPNSKFTTKNALLQNDGMYHPNKRIKRQLEELGIQNSSRASTQCCKKTVLNEKCRVGRPYKVSLMSLPLDAIDMNAVNKLATKQNIKRQHDTYHNAYYSKLNYYSNLETSFKRAPKETYEVRYFELQNNFQSEDKSVSPTNKTVENSKTPEKKDDHASSQHISHPFGSKPGSTNSNSTSDYSKYMPPWGQSFEVRVLEYGPTDSDTDLPMAMSSRRETGTNTGRRKSKYYSYPDEDDYIRNAKRKGTTAERRPDARSVFAPDARSVYGPDARSVYAPDARSIYAPDARSVYGPDGGFPRMTKKETVDRRTDVIPAGQHIHGESRLGLEPWAPFSISDTSLPGLRNTKGKKAPPYQAWGPFPEKYSVKTANTSVQKPSSYKQSEMPNKSSAGTGRTNQDVGLQPIMLTPELLMMLTRGTGIDRQDVGVNPIGRSINFSRGTDYSQSPCGNNMMTNVQHTCTSQCCPVKVCCVSTDTNDLAFEFPRKSPKVTTNATTSHYQQKQSTSFQCDIACSQKASKNEFTNTTLQRSCGQQSHHSKMPTLPGTSTNQSQNQTKQSARNNDTSKETCKHILKDLCLCDYAASCKAACGRKGPNENEVINQPLHSSVRNCCCNTDNHENDKPNKSSYSQNKTACGIKGPNENEVANQQLHITLQRRYCNTDNKSSPGQDKTLKTITDSKADQHRRCYNNNPHVMYYLGEQRNKIPETESNCSDNKLQPTAKGNDQQKSHFPSKLQSSSDHLEMDKNMCPSTDADTLHNPKRQSTTKPNGKTQKSIMQQENIVQFCLEPQSNTMKVPFRPKFNHPITDTPKNKTTDAKQQYQADKIQIDKYYLLCLPNEISSSKENNVHEDCDVTCYNNTNINSSEQAHNLVHKDTNFDKQDENQSQYENISTMLKSHLNSRKSNSKENKTVGSNKRPPESSKSVVKLSSDKYNDSTIYVFQAEPKLDSKRCAINQQKHSSIIRHTDVSPEIDVPVSEKITLNGTQISTRFPNRELKTEKLTGRKYETQSDIPHYQMVNKKGDAHGHDDLQQKENSDKVNSKESYIFKQILKELKNFKDECNKHNIPLLDDSYSKSSRTIQGSNHQQMVTKQKPSQDREILKHIEYCSIGINTDSGNESTSETFTLNQSYSDVCNPPDDTEPSPMKSSSTNESLNMPAMEQYNISDLEHAKSSAVYEGFPKGWTEQSTILLKQFGTAIANITTEVATNKVTEENKLINKRSAKTAKNESHRNSNNNKEHCNDIPRLTENLIYGCLPQNMAVTSGTDFPYISSPLIKDNAIKIPVSTDTSKYRIIISQLADASTCTQNVSTTSSMHCLKDVEKGDTRFICKRKYNCSKPSADMHLQRDCRYYDSQQPPIYCSKGTQSPPVIYRSKLSDFIKRSIPGYQFPKNCFNCKLEIDNCNLVHHQPNTSNENEHKRFTKTAQKCENRTLQTDDHTANNPKSQKPVLNAERCNLVNQKSCNVMKKTQKITKNTSHPINNNNDKQQEAFMQYVDGSQQTEDFTNNKDTGSGQLPSDVDDKENRCSVKTNQRLVNKTKMSKNNDHITSDALKISRESSKSAVNKLTVPLDSNSVTYIEAYKSRLFACNSWLNLPIQLENTKCTLGPNLHWIPPDYDESEFNVRASDSRLSNCLSSKDNNDHNVSRKSSQISDTNEVEVEFMCNIKDKENACPHNLSKRNSNKHLKGNKTYSFAKLREEASFPPRIIPVALAMSQEECQKVSSGPIIPVVLAISDQEYQKVSPTAPGILTSGEMHHSVDFLFHQANVCENESTINNIEVDGRSATALQEQSSTQYVNINNTAVASANSEKSLNTQQESITKQLSDHPACSSKTSNCYEQQILGTMDVEVNKTQDKVYWALTRVKTHRDGSQDFEILETTPIPPGHFLIPTANSVVLVGNQPYISAENKQVHRK